MKIFDKNDSSVAQLIESPNQWAIKLWRDGVANNWEPQTIDMSGDIEQWRDKNTISEDERLLVKRTLGLFAAGESLVSNSVATVERKFITDGACRQYMGRKDYEETLHNFTVSICCEAYNLDVKEVAEAYRNIPTIKKKEQFLSKSLDSFGLDFNIETKEGKQQFLRNVITFYLVCEGTWFFSNFALILSLGRQKKLMGLCDQIQYTMRDETGHVEFGIEVVNTAKKDYPTIWTEKFKLEILEILKEGVDIELEYAEEILPNGILGVNSSMLSQYIKFLADSRLEAIGLDPIYNQKENPFPWLGEAQDTAANTAFFERRNKDYQSAASLEDDF